MSLGPVRAWAPLSPRPQLLRMAFTDGRRGERGAHARSAPETNALDATGKTLYNRATFQGPTFQAPAGAVLTTSSRSMTSRSLSLAICAGLALTNLAPAQPAEEAAAPPTFARDLYPFLAKHCFACHGDGKKKGG